MWFWKEIQAVPRQTGLRRINVVAGILCDSMGRVLIAERIGDNPFSGLWEFPGGKIAVGESAEGALARELLEELGVELLDYTHLLNVDHDYSDRNVSIRFYRVTNWRNEPQGLDGQQLRWVNTDDLDASQLLPADLPVIDVLLSRRP